MIGKGKYMTCQKCEKHKSQIDYKGKKYCTWYCAKKGQFMTWFLLGMLVMWFVYPLLKATQTTMVVKWNNLTMNKEEINETKTIGFRTGV